MPAPGLGPGSGGGAGRDPPGMATAAGGTHPTGMHSCLNLHIDKRFTQNVMQHTNECNFDTPA